MTGKLYLYQTPFVEQDKALNAQRYCFDYLDAEMRGDEEKIRGILLKFAIEKELVTRTDHQIYASSERNTGSLAYITNWINFRSLVDEQILFNILEALNQNDSEYTNQLIDLHGRMGILFDVKLLNTIVNRIIQTLDTIPYSVPKDRRHLSWEEIHKKAPFLWVLFLLQTVIRSSVKPLAE